MAEAPTDPSRRGELEQKILQALRDADSSLETSKLVKICQAPKKQVNQVLYQMKKESKVSLRPLQVTAEITESPGPRLSELQEKIYKHLKEQGPSRALLIAKALGMTRAKDVNPDLYKMKSYHLLSFTEESKEWNVAGTDSGRRDQAVTGFRQQYQVPIIMINQSHVSIANSEATQIGHGNVMVRQAENGASASRPLPPTEPDDASAQRPPADAWGPQHVHIEQSVLRRVQLGHGNEMCLRGVLSEGPACNLSGSPPGSATSARPGASLEVQIPPLDPHSKGDTAQSVCIKSCLLEDTTIGSSNKMTVMAGAAGQGGATGSEEDPGELQQDADPCTEVTRPTGHSPPDVGQSSPVVSLPTSELRAVTLRDHETSEKTF